ncbi:MAG: hypothetical protein K0Q71_4999 [Thermomicrobiales bacterium]|nr:hypothetical protein [Thermomicrobiales bacterium]
MPGSPTTPGRAGARDGAPTRVAFRHENSVGTRDSSFFAAQWLAYAYPYRRFTVALASDGARLGADVDRYSFTAVDLHHLLPAGLPAHSHRTVERRTGLALAHPRPRLECLPLLTTTHMISHTYAAALLIEKKAIAATSLFSKRTPTAKDAKRKVTIVIS